MAASPLITLIFGATDCLHNNAVIFRDFLCAGKAYPQYRAAGIAGIERGVGLDVRAAPGGRAAAP
jgi:hypothetical protein